ncbi:MAG TPA: hypothetical protein VG248_11685 [Caulobacteraceae bacterium]|jgi:hypothetical protein|nr:hypothetical protein [Caulobacteraceae bacterium]
MFTKPRVARIVLIVGLATSALALGAVASAPVPEMTTGDDGDWVYVRTGDLDLSRPAGRS